MAKSITSGLAWWSFKVHKRERVTSAIIIIVVRVEISVIAVRWIQHPEHP